ncbi:GNAT family N-acetyltransferase [Oceanirhabdus sp. W0125-5]|uniref:GNAT family N-acetyltransferase n=1 Tax=Oceanirhabdus sp. W0125-5 TaxID=2999116 RepID=UPI0022F300E7|nr:GNAT family N-acetyltransferase [Oceanirhabdus sp. W0125-5]WBW95529.1 GNAT family N-acetyltransferase [Oceanirhabdus sp. W0125-5]
METERLIIRRFKPDDWKDLYEYLSLPEVVEYEPYYTYSEEECKEASKGRAEAGEKSCFWAVCLKGDNKMIGHIFFAFNEPEEFNTWEIGYVFNPKFYGKGYATEASKRILKYGFEDKGAHRIMAHANVKNIASWKVLERLSLRREGCMLQNVWFKKTPQGEPIWNDSYEYAILEHEWKNK